MLLDQGRVGSEVSIEEGSEEGCEMKASCLQWCFASKQILCSMGVNETGHVGTTR